MAEGTPSTKFVQRINSHLLCSLCSNLFNDPVISVQCGHTFCRQCILKCPASATGKTRCPVDERSCDEDSLVINRAVLGQIDDLEVYCSYGLTWSETESDYVEDPNGCPQKVKYGQKEEHEASCEYALLPCPNGAAICGKIRRRDLQRHLGTCTHCTCPHSDKGCKFKGAKLIVNSHTATCPYKGGLENTSNGITPKQIQELQKSNQELNSKVDFLTKKVESLERERDRLTSEVLECTSLMQQMQQSLSKLQERFDRQFSVRRSASATESRGRLTPSSSSPSIYPRSPSTSSLTAKRMVSPSRRAEQWTMPFTFKCIGTLRGHKAAIWDLKVCGNLLFSCGEDCVIKVWDLESLAKGCRHTLRGHSDRIQAMAIGGDYLYSGGGDKAIYVWSLKNCTQVKCIEDAHDNVIAAMACCEEYLYTSSLKEIKVWAANDVTHIHTISGLYHWVRSLTFNPAKDRLYSGGHNTIEIWDAMGKFNLKGKITHQYGSAYSLAVTNAHIIVGTYNQNIHIFDALSQQYLQKLSGHVGTIMCAAVSNSGTFLFTGSTDSTVQLWNLENMLPIQKLSRHEDGVNTIIIRGDLLLTGSDDSEIKVFKYFKMQPGFVPEL